LEKRDWEKIYKQKGDLGYGVLPRIGRAADVFREKGYKKIFDLGCGTGKHSIFLAQRGFDVYGIDSSETAIKITAEKAEALGIRNIHLEQHDMREIPFPDNFFDAVICTWTIHHGTLKQIQQTISEIFRVLKGRGTVITDLKPVIPGSFAPGQEIEKNTYIGMPGEEDVPHHNSTREEALSLFSAFNIVNIRFNKWSYLEKDTRKKHITCRYNIEAIK
jgi:ubiquinone/menaquinone biosynthesis C-methylase UbiE